MITCPFCGHKWRTRSTLPTLCCSACRRKFPYPDQTVEIVGPIDATATCHQCDRARSDLRAVLVDDEAGFICQQCLTDLLNDD